MTAWPNSPAGTTIASHDDTEWWRAAVIYQVYPRSFADSDGDGVGDLQGIISHLDHVADLGADAVWLSPVYRSPQCDNGYDISDYEDIDPLFGTLADLDELIDALHRRGMRLIMDLVVNHTSDQHPWFVASRRDGTGDKADWYFWRDARPGAVPGQPGAEPNNWGAAFSGPAWEWSPERGQYYLHLFSAGQPDLNWDNPEVREAIFAMMNRWLDRGVDGFRMDVINFISKDPALPDGPIDRAGYGDGTPHFSYGPQIHAHLAEMKRRVFDHRSGCYLRVGEMPGVTPEQARELTDRTHGPLDMVFHFDHVSLDHDGDKWTQRPVSVSNLRDTLTRWQGALAGSGWNSLYWSNHDQPRAVTRFGNDGDYWRESATALATVLHLHRGTPYVYQGEEIGMTNVSGWSIDDFRDIESLRHYAGAVDRGEDPTTVLAALTRMSRDNARTPMQWTSGRHGGFSSATPWIPANPNHTWLNATSQVADPQSIYHYYRALIALRHRHAVIVEGEFAIIETGCEQVYAFRRAAGDEMIEVYVNLSDTAASIEQTELGDARLLLGNYDREATLDAGGLAPWEARIYGR